MSSVKIIFVFSLKVEQVPSSAGQGHPSLGLTLSHPLLHSVFSLGELQSLFPQLLKPRLRFVSWSWRNVGWLLLPHRQPSPSPGPRLPTSRRFSRPRGHLPPVRAAAAAPGAILCSSQRYLENAPFQNAGPWERCTLHCTEWNFHRWSLCTMNRRH